MLLINPKAVDPTWKQLVSGRDDPMFGEKLSFVKSVSAIMLPGLDYNSWDRPNDPTGWKWYGEQSKRFAVILHNQAERGGIRAGFVMLEMTVPGYTYTAWYYLVAFHTTDKGLIYIENIPQTGGSPVCNILMARVTVGEPYYLSFLPDIPEYYSGYYVLNSSIRTIKTLQVDW